MCVLCVAEPGKTPTREHLMNSAEGNPHGYGYAFHLESTILTGRGMDAEEMIDRFLNLRAIHTNVWAMFHARYTTHGKTNKANCHPFRVDGSDKIVLAHNGILPIDPEDGEHRSDTRIFAEDFLPSLGVEALDDEEMFEQLERWMGGSKVVVFSADPRTKYGVYFLNQELGHWNDGIWWSNEGYKTSWYDRYIQERPGYRSSYDYHTYAESIYPESTYDIKSYNCYLCGHEMSDREFEANTCLNCSACLDCYEDIADCLCYHGKKELEKYETNDSRLYNYANWE